MCEFFFTVSVHDFVFVIIILSC